MAAIVFATALLFVAAHACASHVDGYTPVPGQIFKSIFKALETGVLEISEGFDLSWLRTYRLLLNKDSIKRFEDLWFERSINALHYGSEAATVDSSNALAVSVENSIEVRSCARPRNRATTSLHDSLVRMIKGKNKDTVHFNKLLATYAFYKVWLHKELGPAESEMLVVCFAIRPKTWRFIDRLIRVRDRSGLLMAFADGWESRVVESIWSGLEEDNPDVITTLIEDYVENHDDPVKIPLDFFKALPLECQYHLAMKLADLRPYYEGIDWHGFYILSRFSGHPSEEIRTLCLARDTNLLVHEGEKMHESVQTPADMEKLSPYVLPNEMWLEILLCLDELSQIYAILEVCKLWYDFRHRILTDSLAVQKAWARDLSDPVKWSRILHNKCYPWNRLFSSPLTSFKCLVSQLNDGAKNSAAIRQEISAAWALICRSIDEGRITVSHKLYLDLYVCCCQAINYFPEFQQLPGMSDEEFVASMETLASRYSIFPIIPDELLEGRCGTFVQMLDKHGDLLIRLLRDDPYLYGKLITHLFLTRSSVPPKIADILAERSSLYTLLLSRRKDTGGRFDIVPQDFTTRWHKSVVSHSVIDLCLSLGSGSDYEALRLMEEAVIGYLCGLQASEETKHKELKMLSADILRFLSMQRKNYSVRELSIIERVLEECRICGEDDDQSIFEFDFMLLLNDPQFTIKVVC